MQYRDGLQQHGKKKSYRNQFLHVSSKL
jgi:hypothetical protein